MNINKEPTKDTPKESMSSEEAIRILQQKEEETKNKFIEAVNKACQEYGYSLQINQEIIAVKNK